MTTTLADSLIGTTPELITWCIGIILAVMMVRRGGARAEKLFFAGCITMFILIPIGLIIRHIVLNNVMASEISNAEKALAMSMAQIPVSILSLAGIVCLVIAFWLRFRIKREETA